LIALKQKKRKPVRGIEKGICTRPCERGKSGAVTKPWWAKMRLKA